MRKTFLFFAILVLSFISLSLTYAEADNTRVLRQVEKKFGKSTVEYLMENMDKETEEHIVRSVISENDEVILSKMLWGEDRENPMYMRAAIIWCVYNRMENSRNSIEKLITPEQFAGYMTTNPVRDWARKLVRDVTIRYVLELNGFENVGRVLPKKYLYYGMADGKRYHIFKTKLSLDDPGNERWDWSLPSPYNDK